MPIVMVYTSASKAVPKVVSFITAKISGFGVRVSSIPGSGFLSWGLE